MKALIGRKLGMTQIFGANGAMIPVTLIQAGPCVVTAVRTIEKDGYTAMQLGFDEAKKLNKAQAGHLKASNATSKHLREFTVSNPDTDLPKVGAAINVENFVAGETVTVTGTSKGKGFAGTIKRHNFHRGPKTHGSRSYRAPGSIGSMYPQNIKKGKKMAGRMGHETVTVKNLEVATIDAANNLLAVKGAVPGARKGLVIIKGRSND